MAYGIFAWVIVVVIALAVFMTVGLVKKKQSAATFVATSIMIFLILSIGYVFISNEVALTPSGLIEGIKIYVSWIYSVAKNIADVTSYVIKRDWSTGNSTIFGR